MRRQGSSGPARRAKTAEYRYSAGASSLRSSFSNLPVLGDQFIAFIASEKVVRVWAALAGLIGLARAQDEVFIARVFDD